MKKYLYLLFLTLLSLSGYSIESDYGNSILINTLPKSGTDFIHETFNRSLSPMGYSFTRIAVPRFHDSYIKESVISNLANKLYYSMQHVDASHTNLYLLSEYLPKFVLHLRDPRQAVISWYHHVEKEGMNYYHLWSDDICPPLEYFSWSESDKLDWQIEHYLPVCISWIDEWCQAIDSGQFDILVTTFEEMVNDIPSYFDKIFNFYNISVPKLIYPEPKPGKFHFRLGEVDEWKRVFTPEQQKRISEIVPEHLLSRFGWE